ncbi:MAG: CPBP family intramembrane glutamic endopeptidase [Bacteroidota bacterium]
MKQPLLGHLTPFAKLIFLFLLTICCLIIFSVVGILLAFPLFHINLFTSLSTIIDFDNPGSVNVLKYLQIIQSIGLFIVPALLAGWLFGGGTFSYPGLNRNAPWKVFLMVFIIMFISLPFVNMLTSANELMKLPQALKGFEDWMKSTEKEAADLTDAFLAVNSLKGLLVNLFMIAVIPAIGEELFFRGILQRLFGEWFKNRHVAILFTAFFFGAIHLQFYGILPRIFLGALFGYLYYWTGSLWLPIFAHFLNNGSAVIISFLSQKGYISAKYEDFGATDNLFLIAGSVLFTGFFLFIIYVKERQRI